MTGRRARSQERGQSTVEFALILPVVFALVLLVVQVGVVVYCQIAVTHTAREIARVLVVDPSSDLGPVTSSATSLDPDRLDVEIAYDDSIVKGRSVVIVRVSYHFPAIAGIFEPVLGGRTVAATAAMVTET